MSSSFKTISLSSVPETFVTGNSSVISVSAGCVRTNMFPFIPWDNEDNIITKEFANLVELMIRGICLPLICIVSIFTNMVNMVVFYQHGLKERINACLFTLSLVDLLSIISTYVSSSDMLYMFIIGKGGQLGPVTQFFMRNYLLGFYGLVTSSQMVYCVIAFERCLCITRPLLVKNFMPTKTTVVMLWTMTLVITGPFFLVIGVRYSVMCVVDHTDGSVFYLSKATDFYFRHKFVMDVMYSFVYGWFFPCFSVICVTVCTVVTTIKLKQLSQWRETVSSAPTSTNLRDLAIARTITGTSILFIVCIVPAIVQRASLFVVPEFRLGGRYHNLANVTRLFYALTSAFNNTFNFFIYYAYGSKFRETTHRLFPLCFHNRTNTKKNDVSLSAYKS